MSDRTDIFAGHCSRCAPQQKLIVSVEKNSKHTACNNAMCMVRHYQIDGDVIVDKNMDKCDYIVVNEIIDEKREASIDYLRRVIKGK